MVENAERTLAANDQLLAFESALKIPQGAKFDDIKTYYSPFIVTPGLIDFPIHFCAKQKY